MILQCSHICKSFATDVVLDDVSFHINDNEKAAIVGVNGSGKSTLLKIIVGKSGYDSGDIIIKKEATVGYSHRTRNLNQESIIEEMQTAKPEVKILEKKMHELSDRMNSASGDELDSLIRQYDNARHRFEQLDGYSYESEINGVLKGLGFEDNDFTKPISKLSGGQKTRVALAKMLLQAPDLIILDEPTNHLDMNSIHWLEGYLAGYKGAVLIVAHDRYFLDKIVTKVVELRQTHSTVFSGNYSDYSIKRQALLDSLMKQYMNQQAEIKHQEEVITKLRSYNREKSIKRAESSQKMLDKIKKKKKPIEENTQMHLLFTPKIQSGNDVLTVKNLSKSFGTLSLFSDIAFEVKRGEKVAIIGDNGTGKTTILKMINKMLAPDTGSITLGTNVQIAYYDQEHQVLHMEKTLFEEIQDTYPTMTNTQIRNMLAAFLFTEDDVFKKIKNLSGGERGRVSLAKLMLSDANFLILDEPTNHLDIDSKEILENAINNFEGTVLYVSHDRFFINKTATRILDLTKHQIVNYVGNYDYYLEKKEDNERAQLNDTIIAATSSDNTVSASANTPEGQNATSDTKLSWKQQKEEQARLRKLENEIKKIEAEIEKLENENEELTELLQTDEVSTNSVKLQEISSKIEKNTNRLEELMERWESIQ